MNAIRLDCEDCGALMWGHRQGDPNKCGACTRAANSYDRGFETGCIVGAAIVAWGCALQATYIERLFEETLLNAD